jgi:hypothetical protein
MEILIAVKSCVLDRERGCHDIIRKTWGRDVFGADLRFFTGWAANESFKPDEVEMTVPDDYDGLPHKTREILRYSLCFKYDFTFLCDNDTFIVPHRLMSCGFELYDLSGRFVKPVNGGMFHYRDTRGFYPALYPWPSGGFGYFVSKKAAEIVIRTEPTCWAEDMYIGQALGPHIQSGNITGFNIPDYAGPISRHWSKEIMGQAYDPANGWMERMQKEVQ